MVAALVLAGLFLVGALVGTWRVWRRLPRGWHGVLLRAGTLILSLVLAFVAWTASLPALTSATYVCLVCGRTEWQTHFVGLTCDRELTESGDDYVQRFLGGDAGPHAHDWHLESCLFNGRSSVSCTMETVARWFRTLPRLRDRAAAERAFREAQALEREERCRLMNEFGRVVAFRSDKPGGIDAAFEAWCAERR